MNIITEHSLWFIPLCLLLAAAYAYVLYGKVNKSNRTFSKNLRYALFGLRFITVFTLLFLLLNPLLKTITEEREKPLFIVAADKSKSMILNGDSTFIKNELPEKTAALKAALEQDYRVEYIEFGSNINTQPTDSFQQVYTDFEQLFQTINNKYIYGNLGGSIIISDGLYNRGQNPLYFNFDRPVRFFTVGAGDTTARRDVAVKRVIHNDIVFFESTFPVEVDVAADRCAGESATVSIYQNGEELKRESITFDRKSELKSVRFNLNADEPGIKRYTVKVTHLDNELIYENNERDFYVEVIDNRNKILLLGSSPHPDIGAFDRALSTVKTYETEVKLLTNHTQTPDFTDYSLVIAFHLGDKKYDGVIQNLKESKVPVLWKFGHRDDINRIGTAVPALQINGNGNKTNDVNGAVNSAFNLFTYEKSYGEVLSGLPPVELSLADYELSGSLTSLLVQQVGKVKTQQPLAAYSTSGEFKYGVILGEGYFRWRQHNYLNEGNTAAFDDFIRKSAAYLMTVEDRSRFRVNYEPRTSTAVPVQFGAELYNKSFELINEPDVDITIKNKQGEKRDFTFARSGNKYSLNRGRMEPGEYLFEARTALGNEQFEKTGLFTVENISIESEATRADFNLMRNLAGSSGGQFVTSREMDQLPDIISGETSIKTVLREFTKFSDVIELEFLFFLFLFLISLEWFTRKYTGGY